MSEYFRPGSADEILASNLSNGDVLLINRRCSSLPLLEAAVCLASKYGLSGSGRGCWDHAAIVMRDPKSNVPYILEGDSAGVRFRTYEERLMQSTDHQELLWLPLRGLPDGHTRTSMETLIKDFDMRQTIDGAESTSSRCRNVWAAYRDIRSPPKKFGADLSRASGRPGETLRLEHEGERATYRCLSNRLHGASSRTKRVLVHVRRASCRFCAATVGCAWAADRSSRSDTHNAGRSRT